MHIGRLIKSKKKIQKNHFIFDITVEPEVSEAIDNPFLNQFLTKPYRLPADSRATLYVHTQL